MKFNNLIKYALRFIFLQGFLSFFIVFYFENFLISSQDFKEAIYQNLVQDYDSGDDEDKNEDVRRGMGTLFGWLFNIFGSTTEAADTRNWLSLPRQIYVVRLPGESKSSAMKIELLDSSGRVVKVKKVSLDKRSTDGRAFVNLRIFL